jgi:hypothetical protein
MSVRDSYSQCTIPIRQTAKSGQCNKSDVDVHRTWLVWEAGPSSRLRLLVCWKVLHIAEAFSYDTSACAACSVVLVKGRVALWEMCLRIVEDREGWKGWKGIFAGCIALKDSQTIR